MYRRKKYLKLASGMILAALTSIYLALVVWHLTNPGFKQYPSVKIVWDHSFWRNFDPYVNLGVNILSEKSLEYNGRKLVIREITYNGAVFSGRMLKVYAVMVYPKDVKGLPGVVLVHGYGGTHESMMGYALAVAKENFVVLAIDAPGHGRSEGPRPSPYSVANMSEGAESLLFYLVVSAARRGLTVLGESGLVDPGKLAISGASMGGVVSYLVAATDRRVKAAIPIVASGDFIHIVRAGGLANTMIPLDESLEKLVKVVEYIDPLHYARNITCPILILFSSNDEFFTLESLHSTYADIGSQVKILHIAANWNHFREYPGWLGQAINFLKQVFYGEEVGKLHWTVNRDPLFFKIECTSPKYVGFNLYFRPALKGFPWMNLNLNKGFLLDFSLPILFPLNMYVEAGSEGFLQSTSIFNRGGPTIILHLIIIIILFTQCFSKVIKRNVEDALHLTAYLFYIISLFTPFLVLKDRFEISLPELIERYGVYLGLLNLFPYFVLTVAAVAGIGLYLKRPILISVLSLVTLFVEGSLVAFIGRWIPVSPGIGEFLAGLAFLATLLLELKSSLLHRIFNRTLTRSNIVDLSFAFQDRG